MAGDEVHPASKERGQKGSSLEKGGRKKHKSDDDTIMDEFVNAGVIISKDALDDDSDKDDEAKAKLFDTELCARFAAWSEDEVRNMLFKVVYETPIVKKTLLKDLAAPPVVQAKIERVALDISRDNIGEYKILVPYLREQWAERTAEKMVLKISPSEGGSHVWASFHFGVVSGIIRSCGPIPKHTGDICYFMWRGREEIKGEVTYGDENIGSITFLGEGKIRGVINWKGKFEFIGKKLKATEEQAKARAENVCRWKGEWRGISHFPYGYASSARWGRGGSRGGVPNSDTDNHVSSHDSESDSEGEDDEDF